MLFHCSHVIFHFTYKQGSTISETKSCITVEIKNAASTYLVRFVGQRHRLAVRKTSSRHDCCLIGEWQGCEFKEQVCPRVFLRACGLLAKLRRLWWVLLRARGGDTRLLLWLLGHTRAHKHGGWHRHRCTRNGSSWTGDWSRSHTRWHGYSSHAIEHCEGTLACDVGRTRGLKCVGGTWGTYRLRGWWTS